MQEAIDNSYKHSNCSEFCFLLDDSSVCIGDNVQGFNLQFITLGQRIPVMQESTKAMVGKFQITIEVNGGTKIEIFTIQNIS